MGLEEEERKRGRCGLNKKREGMGFWVLTDFGLGLWMSQKWRADVTPQKYPRIFIIILLYILGMNWAKLGFSGKMMT